jgi:ketosteroid isomerase-like protein
MSRLVKRSIKLLVGVVLLVTGVWYSAQASGGDAGPRPWPQTSRVAADKVAIMELANRFENTFDDADLEGHLATVSDDIVFTSDVFGSYRGKDAYRAWVQPFLEGAAASGGTRHVMSNFEIRVRGNRARATSYLTIYSRSTLQVGGLVEFNDELAKVNGRWIFTRRSQVVDLPPAAAPQ